MDIYNSTLFALTKTQFLSYNITNITDPVLLDAYSHNVNEYSLGDMIRSNEYYYATFGFSVGLIIMDISNTTNLQEVYRHGTNFNGYTIEKRDDYLIIGASSKITILYLSSETIVVYIGATSYYQSDQMGGSYEFIDIINNNGRYYATVNFYGLVELTFDNPEKPWYRDVYKSKYGTTRITFLNNDTFLATKIFNYLSIVQIKLTEVTSTQSMSETATSTPESTPILFAPISMNFVVLGIFVLMTLSIVKYRKEQ
jgi:hypothetical protein